MTAGRIRRLLLGLLLLGLAPIGGEAAIPSRVAVHVVVDGSGSMRSMDPAGPRIDLLRSGVASFARKHDRAEIGLRSYGDNDGLTGCGDTTLQVAPGSQSPEELSETLRAMRPKGSSPISSALRRAVRDLAGGIGTQVVVLVADGGDTCSQDALADVANVMGEVPEVRIEVIGLNVKHSADREQLEEIAGVGGGRYFPVADASQLAFTLGKIAADSYRREDDRVARLEEEERRRAELVAKTRLKVTFAGDFPTYFCDGLFVEPLRLNGTELLQADQGRVPCDGSVVILDAPRPPGEYTLEVGFTKELRGERTRGDSLAISATVESGRTTVVDLRAGTTLLSWTLKGEVTVE
jgi:hypothetical protein